MIRSTLTALALLLAACGAPSSVDETTTLDVPAVADRLITDGERLADMLAGVDSVETAEAVRPRLEEIGEEYRALFERFETEQPDLGFSDITALASRLPQIAESQSGLATEIERIYRNHPDAADVLREALEDLGRAQP